MSTLVRVVNQQRLVRSILIDKVDRSQGNFETGISYAQVAKQKVYVPYSNPLDPSVKGYIDMVPTDDVLLALNGKGVLAQLAAAGYVSTTLFNSSLTATPHISAASNPAGAPVGGQTGSAASIAAAVGGKATITGLTGMTSGSVGHDLTFSNTDAANTGTFKVTDFISATSVKVANPAAVLDSHNGAVVWTESTESRLTITGTGFLSLAPDVSYVTVQAPGGATQILTDSAIIAAGAPSAISGTSITIADSLITIGTPTSTWKVTVQANSKKSNTFTL